MLLLPAWIPDRTTTMTHRSTTITTTMMNEMTYDITIERSGRYGKCASKESLYYVNHYHENGYRHGERIRKVLLIMTGVVMVVMAAEREIVRDVSKS